MVDLRELSQLAIPPAPEDKPMRRARLLSTVFCALAALAVAFAGELSAANQWLILICPALVATAAWFTIRLYFKRRRYDEAYWTEERRVQHYYDVDARRKEQARQKSSMRPGPNSLHKRGSDK